ncbi:flagellar basal body rod protein FlgB [Labrys wisconsinensis]|uniref:Flagellar basal body rod protein FlgB n=1 Tax=Labrys wisconsinensis TaxID=425677 RepID=A0ABU0JE56_9HYPH|nr:flagellar basal body rod protein FlgB [Labrys wisconsinensis]MDQ0471422.1 flagellar basal-body rod protein FlgB [Labrys wisconsinensis]
MAFADIPLVDMLKTRMRWLEARQKVLAENVANAETPGYRERDLKPLGFGDLVAGGVSTGAVTAMRTSPMHISTGQGDEQSFGAAREKTFETTPDGNSVVLEDEMTKVAETQQDYQVASLLYTKSLGLLKMAVKGG